MGIFELTSHLDGGFLVFSWVKIATTFDLPYLSWIVVDDGDHLVIVKVLVHLLEHMLKGFRLIQAAARS